MHNNEIQQMLMTIIEYAKSAKLSEFHFIRDWYDYRFCSAKCSSFKLLIKGLRKTSNRLFKKYCLSVASGEGNFNQLLAYQQLQQVIRFYQYELDNYTNMVHEYNAYLMDGHLISAFFGEFRADSDLHDFRE